MEVISDYCFAMELIMLHLAADSPSTFSWRKLDMALLMVMSLESKEIWSADIIVSFSASREDREITRMLLSSLL